MVNNSKCARFVSQFCETITKIHHQARGHQWPLFILPTIAIKMRQVILITFG